MFLTEPEALQLISSLRGNAPLPAHQLFNWILIVNEEITERVRSILATSTPSGTCNTKVPSCNPLTSTTPSPQLSPHLNNPLILYFRTLNSISLSINSPPRSLIAIVSQAMFLLVPSMPSTKEYHKYFINEVKEFGNQSVHPLIAKYAAEQRERPHPHNSVSSVVKAVWSLTSALRKLETQTCSPFMSRTDCVDKIKARNLLSALYNETRALDDQVFGSSIATLEGFRLNFDNDNLLRTNKYVIDEKSMS